jgi:MFS family permease
VYDADWVPRLSAWARGGRSRSRWKISGNVWGLGLTSLLTDASSEMIVSVLPAYLVLSAGLAPLALGMATGLHAGGPILATWLGGVAADRSGRRKLTAAAGYGVSAACRLGWLLALVPTPILSTVAFLTISDRIGKAIRTAPRDAIISLSAPPDHLAAAFGVHRALDAAGAAVGPLIAWLVLWSLPRRYDVVFFSSLVLALLGLVALVLFVADKPTPGGPTEPGPSPMMDGALSAFAAPLFRRVALLASAFGVVTIADPFLYLLVVQRSHTGAQWIPLFYTGTALSFLLLAIPLGSLADLFGRSRVFVGGHLSLLLAYGVVAGGWIPWPWTPIACVLLLGAYYATSDGVLAGLAGGLLPEETRATGLAWIATAVALGRVGSALIFGLLWTRYGDAIAVLLFAMALALMIALFMWRGGEPEGAWAA